MRARPWAAIARVPTREGHAYFKANGPLDAFEGSLTRALGRRSDLVAEVLAIDVEQGWMLTRDIGPQLRDVVSEPPDPSLWHTLLPRYAELQIELSDSVDELLAMGMSDLRPHLLPQRYDDLLSRWPGAEPAPARAEIEALVERLGDVIPASVTHQELGDNNIVVGRGGPVVIDWAEAVVGHPFAGLVNTFRGLVDRWGFEPGGAGLSRLRDAYLEPWTRFAPMGELIELFPAAYTLGMAYRAMSWDEVFAATPHPDRLELEDFVPAWLEIMAEALETGATLGA